MDKPSDGQYVNILFDQELLKSIEDFRFEHRVPTRTEAIRRLIQAGLIHDKQGLAESSSGVVR